MKLHLKVASFSLTGLVVPVFVLAAASFNSVIFSGWVIKLILCGWPFWIIAAARYESTLSPIYLLAVALNIILYAAIFVAWHYSSRPLRALLFATYVAYISSVWILLG
jgi:hypothetical protein